jgi:hypothetical protein
MTNNPYIELADRRTPRGSASVAAAAALLAVAAMVVGCSVEPTPSATSAAPATTRPVAARWWVPPNRSGAELWAANCQRCHNMQSPARFSDAQWGVITHHMRLRADLTGEETRAITEFLKSGS